MTAQETASRAQELLIEKLSDTMDPDNARAMVDDAVRDLLAENARLRDALLEIATHDSERGAFTDEDVWERKPSPQEIATAALAGEETADQEHRRR